jgi:hypothetical protein
MTEQRSNPLRKVVTPDLEKKGGYTGGKPAKQVGPPPPTPSGTVKPSTNSPTPPSGNYK